MRSSICILHIRLFGNYEHPTSIAETLCESQARRSTPFTLDMGIMGGCELSRPRRLE